VGRGVILQTVQTVESEADTWTKVIEEARRSAGGVAAYCQSKGLSKRIYYDWFARLRVDHPEWQNLMNGRSANNSDSKSESPAPAVATTEVREKTSRRTFSASEKRRILLEADKAPRGNLAALLRREGLYSSQLQKWRSERDGNGLEARKRGPKAEPLAAENKKLKAQNERLEKRLNKANKIIEFQKKVSELLGVTLEEMTDGE
jgi:transposase-like protein